MPPYGRFWFSITIVMEDRVAMNESIARREVGRCWKWWGLGAENARWVQSVLVAVCTFCVAGTGGCIDCGLSSKFLEC